MDWHDLGNPYLRSAAEKYRPLEWPAGVSIRLATAELGDGGGLADVVATRRSSREFGPLSLEAIGPLLSLTCGVHRIGHSQLGFPISQRTVPSAGAIHPIHIVVNLAGSPKWHRYAPFEHELIAIPTKVSAGTVRAAMNEVLPGDSAALLLFVAEPSMTAAKYADPASLVWRDAGVLQGYLTLAAESLRLNCSLLGVTGEPWCSSLVEQGGLHGVGAAYVGGRGMSPPPLSGAK